MPTSAVHSKLVLIERSLGGSPDAYESIGEVTNFDGPTMSAPTEDATSLESSWAEKLVGVPDGGQVTFGVNWISSNGAQNRLREDFAAGTLRSYRIRKADGTLTAITFSAYVTSISPSGAVNAKISGSFTLTITGAVN